MIDLNFTLFSLYFATFSLSGKLYDIPININRVITLLKSQQQTFLVFSMSIW